MIAGSAITKVKKNEKTFWILILWTAFAPVSKEWVLWSDPNQHLSPHPVIHLLSSKQGKGKKVKGKRNKKSVR